MEILVWFFSLHFCFQLPLAILLVLVISAILSPFWKSQEEQEWRRPRKRFKLW